MEGVSLSLELGVSELVGSEEEPEEVERHREQVL